MLRMQDLYQLRPSLKAMTHANSCQRALALA
jgi:hypothetical protein